MIVDTHGTLEKVGKFGRERVQRLLHVIQYPDNGIPSNNICFSPLRRPRAILFPKQKHVYYSVKINSGRSAPFLLSQKCLPSAPRRINKDAFSVERYDGITRDLFDQRC